MTEEGKKTRMKDEQRGVREDRGPSGGCMESVIKMSQLIISDKIYKE